MPPRVLLLGGHGKVSLLLTPLLLRRSWSVASVIRDPSQTDEILSKGHGQPGKIDVLVRSLDDITSEQQAQSVLDEVKPQYVVWSAGTFPSLFPSSCPRPQAHLSQAPAAKAAPPAPMPSTATPPSTSSAPRCTRPPSPGSSWCRITAVVGISLLGGATTSGQAHKR